MANLIKYSSCWEDAYLLADSLAIDENSDVVSIASAGDNSLYMLSKQPKSMTCIDMNPVQIYLCQLKEAAVKYLDFADFEALLGFVLCDTRIEIFNKLSPNLPKACGAFFTENISLIKNGIIHQGKLEKYFQLFASKILPLIHSKEEVRKLFKPKSEEAQADFYNNVWNNWRWKAFFRIFFSKAVMGLLGREKAKMKYVEGKVGELIFTTAENHLKSKNCQHNYMLKYVLSGSYYNERPPYAYAESFRQAKEWLQQNEIHYAESNLEDWLSQGYKYNRFNLSNIFEYMSEEEFDKNIFAIENASAKGAKICYWNLMVPRIVPQKSNFVREDKSVDDLGFFYREFHCLINK
jgi:S-adenosylmethionine-diacylglycerol 3-amino-3-carboxypropyl transferase